jgi:hypothetical protein
MIYELVLFVADLSIPMSLQIPPPAQSLKKGNPWYYLALHAALYLIANSAGLL